MPTDHTYFFQSWNLKHTYFFLAQANSVDLAMSHLWDARLRLYKLMNSSAETFITTDNTENFTENFIPTRVHQNFTHKPIQMFQ